MFFQKFLEVPFVNNFLFNGSDNEKKNDVLQSSFEKKLLNLN